MSHIPEGEAQAEFRTGGWPACVEQPGVQHPM